MRRKIKEVRVTKETIKNVIKKCEICQINNRKRMGGCEFVQTSRPLEKVSLDVIDTIGDGYGLLAIDNFSRVALIERIGSK